MSSGARRAVSIQTALVLAFVVVAALPIVFLSVQRYLWVKSDLLRADLAADSILARSIASGLSRYMTQWIHVVNVLGRDVGLRGFERPAAMRTELETVMRRNPIFTSIVVIDHAGVVRVAVPERDITGRSNIGKRFDDRSWFKAAIAGARPPYEIVISRGTSAGKPAMPMVAAVRSVSGQIVGVVAGALDLDIVRSVDDDVDRGGTKRIVLVDSRGRVIAHRSDDWEREARDLSGSEVFKVAQRQHEGSVRDAPDATGAPEWGTFARVAETGWVVWVQREEEIWGARTKRIVGDLALSATVAILIASLVAVVVGRLGSRPLRALVEAAQEVAAGRFETPALQRPRPRIRELAELITGFGNMAQSLRALYVGLEVKVAERTRELEDSAREARATAALLRAHDEIRRGYAELAALLNSLDRSHILEEGTRKVAQSLHAPLAAVYLTDNGPETLRLKTYTAVDPSLVTAAALSASGVPREAALRREPIVVAPMGHSQHVRLDTGLGGVDIAAVVALPLSHRDRLLGVLVVALLAPPGEEVQDFLGSASRQLSVALSNAGLFESVRYQSQQLEQLNADLRRASDVKSEFLASMSHELRTPLNSIIGFTEIVLASARDPLSARQRTAIEKVLTSGRHLLGLINQVLDLSKIEAGRMEVHAERFPLSNLATECLAVVEPVAQAKGLALSVVGAEAAPTILQDRAKLKQVIVNLLGNAVKFTAQGSVELRLAPVQDKRVAIAVADTGIGIAPEHHAAVFESFRQVGTPAAATGGSGLGLAITKRLVELLGGSIVLDSAPGRGSVFTVIVPLGADVQAEEAPAMVEAGTPRILVVDDDQDVVEIIRGATRDERLAIDWASNARAGLDRVRASRPAAIVLDVILQDDDDGWDVLAVLKRDPATRDIPVLVHSAIDNPHRAQALGADAILVKPASSATIAEVLRRLVSRAVPAATGVS